MRIIKNVLLALLLIFNIILVIKLQLKAEEKSAKSSSDHTINYYKSCFTTIIKHNDNYIAEPVVKNQEREKVSLQDKVNQDKLIIRISELHCNACIEFMMVKLKKYIQAGRLDPKKVFIFAHYNNPKLLTMLINKYELKNIPVYLKRSVDIPLEKYNMPYCFILREDMNIDCAFVPDKSVPYTFDTYLQNIY